MFLGDFLQGIPIGLVGAFEAMDSLGYLKGYTIYAGAVSAILSALVAWGGWIMADSWIIPYWASVGRVDVGNWSATIMKIYQTLMPFAVFVFSLK